MSNGKGDLRRPTAIPDHELRQRWIECFGDTERAPLNPNVARTRIAEFESAQTDERDAGKCNRCGLSLKYATKCHRASWQKQPGPRRQEFRASRRGKLHRKFNVFDHSKKHHLSGPKHANVPGSIRGPVRQHGKEDHRHDPKFEKAQLKKDEPKPAKKIGEQPKKPVAPFPGDKTEK